MTEADEDGISWFVIIWKSVIYLNYFFYIILNTQHAHSKLIDTLSFGSNLKYKISQHVW